MARTPLFPRGGDFVSWALNITRRIERDFAALNLQADSLSAAFSADLHSVSAVIKADISSVSAVIKTDISSVSAAITTAYGLEDDSVSAVIKADISSVSAAIKADITSVSAAIKADISSVSAAIKADITSVSAVIKADISSVSSTIETRIQSLSATVSAVITNRRAVAWGSFTAGSPPTSLTGYNVVSMSQSITTIRITYGTNLSITAGVAVAASCYDPACVFVMPPPGSASVLLRVASPWADPGYTVTASGFVSFIVFANSSM